MCTPAAYGENVYLCVESYVKDMLGKRLVVLGVSSATGMYAIFMAKARGLEGVAELLGAECGLCH